MTKRKNLGDPRPELPRNSSLRINLYLSMPGQADSWSTQQHVNQDRAKQPKPPPGRALKGNKIIEGAETKDCT